MKRRWQGGVLILVLLATGTAQGQPGRSAEVDTLFAAWDRKDSPGCVVLVRQDGKTVHGKAYGMANLELGVPLSLSSVFLLASVSKQFVVFCIMLLAQGGQLSLDDDVRKHVPELPDFGQKITIRHLINHTSGLREDLTLFNLAGWRSGDVITQGDFLRLVKGQKELNFAPGAEYAYCNTGYHLLALIVERVGKKPFPEFAREKIFEPLGMKSTVIRDSHRALIPNLAGHYAPGAGGTFTLARLAHDPPGASNCHSTALDLALWDQNFYDATVGDRKLLDDMQVRGTLTTGKDMKYAGGLVIDTYRGKKTVSHTGSHGGFKTVILRFPEQRFTAIILANVRDFNPMRMGKKIADLYLADKLETRPPLPASIPVASKDLDPYLGEYRQGYLLWRISRSGGELFAQVDGGERKRLLAHAEGQFFDNEDGTRYRFFKKKDIPFLETTLETQKALARRLQPSAPTGEKLAALAGTYLSKELGTMTTLAAEGGKLVLRAPKGESTVQFLESGDCLVRPQEAYFSFLVLRFVNEGGKTIGYTLSTERVRNVRFDKVAVESSR